MATALLRSAIQHRELYAFSSFASLASKSKPSLSSPLLGTKFASLIRPFRPAGNDVIGIDLGTTKSCVAVMESKVFSTTADNQTQVGIKVLQGKREICSIGKSLGRTIYYNPKRTLRTICHNPKTTPFPKQHRGRMKGISHQGSRISFGRYALQALQPAWITSRQIEAGRRKMTRNACRGGKLWVRIFPDKPVTAKPVETRMGKGKGSPEYWVAVVKPGRILYEISGVTEKMAREAIAIAASKMPIRTQFLISE